MTLEASQKKTQCPRLQKLLSLPMMVIPNQPSVQAGLSLEQRRRHLHTLYDTLVEVELEPDWGATHLAEVLVECIDRLEKRRAWSSPATKMTWAETLYGALESLKLYTNLEPILLKSEKHWEDATRKWMKDVCGFSPERPEVNNEGVEKVLSLPECQLATATLLTLCWSTTGRPFNWLYVKKDDLKKHELPDSQGTNLSITWRDHKTVGTKQAFTTHSWLPVQRASKVTQWLAKTQGDWVFPKSLWQHVTGQLKELLKKQNSDWDLKALRRGSLSTMARAGVPLEDLMNFSGHKSKATLLRYLRWGAHAGEIAKKSQAAAMHLAQQ
jgi:hypothetical protein